MRLGVVSDIHLCPQGSPPDGWHDPHQFADAGERLRRSIQWLEQQHVEQLAVLGDLTHFGDPASTQEVLEILAESSLPIWILPGNHDLNPGRSVLDTLLVDRTDTLEPVPGRPAGFGPSWSVLGIEMKTAADGTGYHATNHDEVVTLASAHTPTLLLSHFPLLSIREDVLNAGLKYAGDLTNGIAISDSLLDRPQPVAPVLVIHGHLHVRHAIARNGVLQASCAAQIESLFEATVFDLGQWSEGHVSWYAASMQSESIGIFPAMAERRQRWMWDGGNWNRAKCL